MTLNYFGPTYDMSRSNGFNDLVRPSLGNLLPSDTIYNGSAVDYATFIQGSVYYSVNGTLVNINIPMCQQGKDFFSWFGEEDGINCYLNSTTLGYYYTTIDIGLCIIVLFSYLWLKYFEETESKRLDRNTVFASMYTIVFKNLPKECTEESVQKYVESSMAKAGYNYKVAAVNLAFDNHTEIEDCTKRGHLIRKKMRMTNEFRYTITQLRSDLKKKYEGDQGFTLSNLSQSNAYSAARNALDKDIKKQEADFREKIIAIDLDIKNMEGALENLTSRDEKVLAAYVTFNTVRGKECATKVFHRQSYIDYFRAGCQSR